MRKLFRFSTAALVAALASGPASAAPLDVQLEFGIQVATLDPVSITAASVADVTTNNGSHVVALLLDGGTGAVTGLVVPVTDPGAAPIGGLQVTVQNLAADFSEAGITPGVARSFGGMMPLQGVTKVCLFGPCSAAVANLGVPLSNIGMGGTTAVGQFVSVTVKGAPWTVADIPAGYGPQVTIGGAHGPASATTAMNQTASGAYVQTAAGGVLTLVTPIFISTNIPASAVVPGFGFMNITFTPEPAATVLGGAAIGALLLLGRYRTRS
jgi:hypothetical protein